MTVVGDVSRIRHRAIGHEADPRVWFMRCGKRFVLRPRTPAVWMRWPLCPECYSW